MAGNNNSGDNDTDLIGFKRSSDQQKVVSDQLVNLLGSRLQSLFDLADDRRHALECDLKMSSTHCSRNVPLLLSTTGGASADNNPILSIPSRSQHNHSRISNTASSVATVTRNTNNTQQRQVLYERIFGSLEYDLKNSRTRTAQNPKSRLERAAGASGGDKNSRLLLEKQLQTIMEGHVTRSVESIQLHLPNTFPIDINPQVLMAYTCSRMRIVSSKKTFNKVAQNDLSCIQIKTVFWYIYCYFFQPNSEALQQELLQKFSAQYVQTLSSNSAAAISKDFFFRLYPYATSAAVIWGFYYYFPGSRHAYTSDFKTRVYILICELMLGLKLCPTTVTAARKMYFPDEIVEEAKTTSSSSDKPMFLVEKTSPIRLKDIGPSPSCSSLKGAFEHPSTGFDPFTSSRSTLLESHSEPQLTVSSSRLQGLTTLDNSRSVKPNNNNRERLRQVRQRFNASQVSPLVQEFLAHPHENVRKKASYIKRTTPTRLCPVGGENTFRKNESEILDSTTVLKSEKVGLKKAKAKYLRDLTLTRKQLRNELRQIEDQRDVLLSKGHASMNRFCIDLASSRQATTATSIAGAPPSLK